MTPARHPASPTGPRNAELPGGATGTASPCTAFDDEYGVSCVREAGHDGNHRAELSEGETLAWPTGDDPCPTCGRDEPTCGLHEDDCADCCKACRPAPVETYDVERDVRDWAPCSARGD
jgi:hypothetical protein